MKTKRSNPGVSRVLSRRVFSSLCTLCLCGSFLGCGAPDARSRTRAADRLPRLETVEPRRELLPVRIELTATVEALEKAELCARVPGVVQTFFPPDLDIGRRVRAGEPLVQLAVPELVADLKNKEALLEQARRQKLQADQAIAVAARELDEARAQEKRYQADYAFRKDQHQRTTQLVERQALTAERAQETRSQLEAAESAWRVARAQIDTREARLGAARLDLDVADSKVRVAEAEVERLQTLVDLATVRAPFAGVITKRWVDRGATIKDAGAPLLTLMHTDTVRVLLDIPERDVPLVPLAGTDPGGAGDREETVVLRIPALRETVPGGVFRGVISRSATALDPATRTMRAEVHLDNRAGHLRPGMYGRAAVLLAERYNVLTIPTTALVRRGDRTEVFVVTERSGDPPRGVVRRVEVELGHDDGLRVEVRRGLRGDEQVIAKGNGVVREGEAVYAVPARPN